MWKEVRWRLLTDPCTFQVYWRLTVGLLKCQPRVSIGPSDVKTFRDIVVLMYCMKTELMFNHPELSKRQLNIAMHKFLIILLETKEGKYDYQIK